MFGSEVIEVAIGIILLFLFVSLICTAIREVIESIFKTRAMDLERGVRQLFDDAQGSDFAKHFFDHPQIYALFAGDYDPKKLSVSFLTGLKTWLYGLLGLNKPDPETRMPWGARKTLPSYIPAASFSAALLDLLARGPVSATPSPNLAAAGALSLEQIRASVNTLPNARLQRAVLNAIDLADGDLQAARTHLETWFNANMDRVAGWYKRRTQTILLALGLGAAVFLNIDAITVTGRLFQDKALRAAVVAEAGKVSDQKDTKAAGVGSGQPQQAAGKDLATKLADIDGLRAQFEKVGFPIGWPAPQAANNSVPYQLSAWQVVTMVLGWLITGLAVTLGAPFWFDLLSKVMVVRSTLKPVVGKPAGQSPAGQ